MNNDAVEFVEKWSTYLLSIGGYCIQRYVNISVHARTRTIIKGNNIGIVIVLEKLAVYGKDLLIVAKNIGEFAHGKTMLSSYGFDPLLNFAKVDRGHCDIVVDEVNHGGVES